MLFLFTVDRLEASDTDENEVFAEELPHADDAVAERRHSIDAREDCDRCARADDAKPTMKTISSDIRRVEGNIRYRRQTAANNPTGSLRCPEYRPIRRWPDYPL